ncbi:VOC family protein [Psychrobacillus psychrodurans]|jgi:PhnB protein|uniref:VOC family protein n=1 Tax=Psychrobacillus psychrodurans TaxID=126157 RepID=UPI0008E34FDF|nr:VOC family protein [Psychrobacillus psychrodurans]MCZ8542280.1 VOC family protein [Psychrobacillus psychrodurans]SFN20185.1 PhnB protein [Psychrobacillus psychrodurans]
MAIDVYLTFNGNCREAAEFYAEVFKTEKPEIMTFGESPQNPDYVLPEEAKDLVLHTRLNINGSNIMFSDTFPGSPFMEGNNISLAFVSKEEDMVKSAFNALKEGGRVSMELQETFWSKCYGSLRDKFGIEWQFSHETDQMPQ